MLKLRFEVPYFESPYVFRRRFPDQGSIAIIDQQKIIYRSIYKPWDFEEFVFSLTMGVVL